MANPQLKNGFFRIANEWWQQLCRTRINGEARQVLDVIIYKTYGFNKKTDWIALSQFCQATGLSKPAVCKAIKKLLTMNIIIITQKDNGDVKMFMFNKDFDTWEPLPKKITLPKKIMGVLQKDNAITQKDNIRYPKRVPHNTQDTITQDNIQKTCEQSSPDIVDLINIFKPINPTINFGNKTTRKAAADLIKQFGKEKATEYAHYAVSVFGMPYAPVITTPYDLREKLSKLAAFHTSDKNKQEKIIVTKV